MITLNVTRSIDQHTLMARFYQAIEADRRISPSHISLYMALLHTQNEYGRTNAFPVKRQVLMNKAKILARQTYNKCMNELKDYGYIQYAPALNGSVYSRIFLNTIDVKS